MRSKEMQTVVDKLAKSLFGRSNSEAQAEQVCVMCGASVVNGFRDSRSEKEYRISGMCQKCQDDFYGL